MHIQNLLIPNKENVTLNAGFYIGRELKASWKNNLLKPVLEEENLTNNYMWL